VLYGQSIGAAAILRAVSVQGARAEALVLECPFDRLVNTVGNRFRAMGLPAFPGARLLVFWGGVQQGFDGFGHNPVDYAADVSCPVLLLHGTDDPWVSVEQVQAIFHELRGPKRLQLFEGLGHESYLATRPGEWTQAVAGFLTDHVPGAAPPAK
jgi:alpha-beta hydrolase superfamily lysophospholipase